MLAVGKDLLHNDKGMALAGGLKAHRGRSSNDTIPQQAGTVFRTNHRRASQERDLELCGKDVTSFHCGNCPKSAKHNALNNFIIMLRTQG